MAYDKRKRNQEVSDKDNSNNSGFGAKSGNRNQSSSKNNGKRSGKGTGSKNSTGGQTKGSTLTDLAGNVSFYNVLGNNVPILSDRSGKSRSFTGIQTVSLAQTFFLHKGSDFDSNDPVAIAVRRWYDIVNSKNSRSTRYDPNDVGMYLMALTQPVTLYFELRRVLGMMLKYSTTNRFVGKSIVNALGYDFDDLESKRPELISLINQLAAKINSFAIPADFEAFTYMSLYYDNVFYDDVSTPYPTMIAFIPDGYWSWNDEDGYLKYMAESWTLSSPKTIQNIKNSINVLMNPLLGSEDMAFISTDILRAMENNLFTLAGVDDSYDVEIGYSYAISGMLHNTVFMGKITNSSPADATIIANPNATGISCNIKFEEAAYDTADLWKNGYMMDIPADVEANAGAVSVLSNFMPVATENQLDGCVAIRSDLYIMKDREFSWYAEVHTLYKDVTSYAAVLKVLDAISKIKSAPMIYHATISSGSITDSLLMFGDICRYTTLDDRELNNVRLAKTYEFYGITK